MSKDGTRLGRLGVLAPAALSACIDASVLAAPAAGAILSTVLKELSKAFMLKKWFHGVMSAQDAEHLLMQKGKNGSYLVRESQNHPGDYVLSVRVRGRVSHVMIRREDQNSMNPSCERLVPDQNKYDVGSGENFDDLTELIEHCRAYPLTENSGDILRLMQPVNGFRIRPHHIERPPAVDDVELMQRYDEEIAGSFGGSVIPEQNLAGDGYRRQHVGNGFYGEYVGGDIMAEFRSLRKVEENSSFTSFEGRRTHNQYKNRYRNVIPYDQTRVVLPRDTGLEEDTSDYINASYIKPMQMFYPSRVYEGSRPLKSSSESLPSEPSLTVSSTKRVEEEPPLVSKSLSDEALRDAMKNMAVNSRQISTSNGIVKDKYYIATQGCLSATVNDFWEMIVDNDVRVIAMIGLRVEEGDRKCEKYWPQRGDRHTYGDIHVYATREFVHEFHIIREFEITTASKKHSTVYQYQFKDWPDHEVPTDTTSILVYQEEINKRMLQIASGNNAPEKNILCVHCSAGIGRTGTFITLDMLIDQVKIFGLNTHIDIYSTVKLCRSQRAGMVQNRLQYKFLYIAMRDYLEAVSK